MSKLKPIIEESMIQYSGAVLQNRALIDVRDGLKPSARQIFYSMLLHKLVHSNPYKKTANAVGMSMADFYIHGDSSCEGVIMRAGQPFAMRYPLIDVKGNAGTLIESGNWAAMRYTESRLSQISDLLFNDINKDVIEEWRDNYDNTKQFPSVLPSKGFYNICNGTQGIGIGMASCVPQYNINDVNNALIYLIDHPGCEFEDIYCAPDFATGAILYNEEQVKESMKHGNGFACKLRSVVEFDSKERCFIVTEIPYGVYTNTICGQLEGIVNGEDNPGIERFNDLTGETPLIKIYLSKKANPDKVLKYLYKNTSIQYYYSINFTMLKDGRFPKVFTWKEMLQEHIDHEKVIYRRGFEFDLHKIENRIHIIDGLLICMANIDEVVKTIKSSKSSIDAAAALKTKFLLDDAQAKAVLDMKLARLAHLEVEKLEKEKVDLEIKAEQIRKILNSEELFNNELKNGWREVAKRFGDKRRTKIISLLEGNDDEPIEVKRLTISFTNNAAVFGTESSSLYTQKRNGVGSKFKLDKGEYIIDNLVCENIDTILFFSRNGKFYHCKASEFAIGEKQYLPYSDKDIIAATVVNKDKKNIVFITKNGIIKKSLLSEYNLKRNTEDGSLALKLDAGDEIASIVFTDNEKIGIMSNEGYFIMLDSSKISSIGRVTRGVAGMKLNPNDYVIAANVIKDEDKEIVSITSDGYCKRTNLSEFRVTGRNTKGVKAHKDNDLVDFIPLNGITDLLVVSSTSQIRIKYNDIPLLGRGTQGVKALKLAENSKIVKIEQF